MSHPASENSGCLGMLLQLLGFRTPGGDAAPNLHFGTEDGTNGKLPYRLRDDFLSPAEISFYHVLRIATSDAWTICPKVGLGDLFFVAQPQNNQAARNRIAQKHVDFLICEPRTMKPRAGIELDDSSHDSAKRVARDTLVDDAFAAASLPLLRIRVEAAYQPAELSERLANVLRTPTPAADKASPAVPGETPAPQCPKCNIVLVSRTGTRGKFLGCSNFPRCRHTEQIA